MYSSRLSSRALFCQSFSQYRTCRCPTYTRPCVLAEAEASRLFWNQSMMILCQESSMGTLTRSIYRHSNFTLNQQALRSIIKGKQAAGNSDIGLLCGRLVIQRLSHWPASRRSTARHVHSRKASRTLMSSPQRRSARRANFLRSSVWVGW